MSKRAGTSSPAVAKPRAPSSLVAGPNAAPIAAGPEAPSSPLLGSASMEERVEAPASPAVHALRDGGRAALSDVESKFDVSKSVLFE
jgi:hypothetical protein